MDAASFNILCNIASSIIIGVANKIYLNYNTSKKSDYSKEIIDLLDNRIDDSVSIVTDSGTFEKFMKLPQVSDLLQNYITYKITGELSYRLKDIKSKKKKLNILDENDIINYLVSRLMLQYEKELSIPTKSDLQKYFHILFSCATDFFASKLELNQRALAFFVNNRLDENFNEVYKKLNEISNKISKSMVMPIYKTNSDYQKVKIEYMKSIKQIFEKGFIYLMGEYRFNQFYIAPTLSILDDRMFFDRNRLFFTGSIIFNDIEPAFNYGYKNNSNWMNIFSTKDIVYVVGGAGFGKSLFMKNMINNFEQLCINDSSEHLVIYCELKSFYSGNEASKKSIIDYLQESMISITGLGNNKISTEFIQYFLDVGRCIILFDALDEVSKENREKLHKMIISFFQNCNPNNKICITSRDRGFIPQEDIEVIKICPLSKEEISKYIDKIIELKKFKKEDKSTFLLQTETLIKKNFLNNFLILSLLVNIYKSERELPENKVDLYKKCFEYIAKKREEEKSKTGYNWELIVPLMKDSTFIQLSILAAPNNTDIDRQEVEKTLLALYKSKYADECKTENAIKEFLEFCSNRTELFIPSSGDDKFKFFHRSFFEYFYSKHIYQHSEIEEIYNLMASFDVDSEVFELTVAMIKEDNEIKYQKLIKYIINKVELEFHSHNISLISFNILTLVMQVVDDDLFIKKYLDLIINNKSIFIKDESELKNQNIIKHIVLKAIDKDILIKELFETAFEKDVIIKLLMQFSTFKKDFFVELNTSEILEHNEIKNGFHYALRHIGFFESPFYLCLYRKDNSILALLEKYTNLSKNEFESLLGSILHDRKRKNLVQKGYKNYNGLSIENKTILCKMILGNSLIENN